MVQPVTKEMAPSSPLLSVIGSTDQSSERQPADSWEEVAIDGDPLLTPENEDVSV